MKNKEKENQQRKLNESKPAKSTKVKNYARYSGMAVQLGVTIAVGAFIGRKLDEWFAFEKPLMTALFSLLATITGIYLLIKDIIQK